MVHAGLWFVFEGWYVGFLCFLVGSCCFLLFCGFWVLNVFSVCGGFLMVCVKAYLVVCLFFRRLSIFEWFGVYNG